MKKILFLIILHLCSSTYAEVDICIDPGHGEADPGAPATYQGDTLCWEKDINLRIGILLKEEYLDQMYLIPLLEPLTYEYTRLEDIFLTPRQRARIANISQARAFISIHHNADITTLTQYTMTLYSNDTTECCDDINYEQDLQCCENYIEALSTNTTPNLAKKISYRIEEIFDYENKGAINVGTQKSVLSRSYMASALTEASIINPSIYSSSDESLVYCGADSIGPHALGEAYGILNGISSYLSGGGFGRVDYAYSGKELYSNSSTPTVFVDTCEYREREYEIPYESCWLVGEELYLEAQNFIKNLYYYEGQYDVNFYYEFHHWERTWYTTEWVLGTYDSSLWHFEVPGDVDSIHYFVACFKGGPYKIEILRKLPCQVDNS